MSLAGYVYGDIVRIKSNTFNDREIFYGCDKVNSFKIVGKDDLGMYLLKPVKDSIEAVNCSDNIEIWRRDKALISVKK